MRGKRLPTLTGECQFVLLVGELGVGDSESPLEVSPPEFVEAAISMGASTPRIMVKEILPNLWVPITIYATLLLPQYISAEAALSFLGVGVAGGTPSWGAMIAEATSLFPDAWWFMLFPGLALLLTVLAFNLVGDGLQDALDPRRR